MANYYTKDEKDKLNGEQYFAEDSFELDPDVLEKVSGGSGCDYDYDTYHWDGKRRAYVHDDGTLA